jgi:CheY-like chemotaxis protein
VTPTEEDAHRCSSFVVDNISMSKYFISGGRSFDDKGVQLYYENFRIDHMSSSIVYILLLSFANFFHIAVTSFLEYENIWLIRSAIVLRNIICILALYVVYKVFYVRVRPESSTREEFRRYVASVVRLSNFIVVAFALVNGFVYAWKSSLGSCLIIQENHASVNQDDHFFLNCNPSYEIGPTPTDSMVLLLVGNILIVTTVRSHSFWAVCVSYVTSLLFVIASAVVSPSPRQSVPTIILAVVPIFIYICMENNSFMMFTALLKLSSTSPRIVTTSRVAAPLPQDREFREGVGSLSALIVEDSIVISKSTKRMLEKSGYKVDVAENGAIGLEKMKAKVYSVVIMDLQMPVMDGLEATRRMRLFKGDKELQASGKHQQFIIGSSANGADDVMKEAMDSGMDMFVEKPFSMAVLEHCREKDMLIRQKKYGE